MRAGDRRCCGTAAAAAGRRAGRQTHPARACAPTPHILPYVLQLSFKTSNKTNVTCASNSRTILKCNVVLKTIKLLAGLQMSAFFTVCLGCTGCDFSDSAGIVLGAIRFMMHINSAELSEHIQRRDFHARVGCPSLQNCNVVGDNSPTV